MALNAGNEIENKASGIVVKGTAVEGGYFVTDIKPIGKLIKGSPEALANPTASTHNIPSYAHVLGTLCYCTEDSKFYQYNGTGWVKAPVGYTIFNGSADSLDTEFEDAVEGDVVIVVSPD